MMTPQRFIQLLNRGEVETVKGLHGRIIRGHSDEDFRTLTNDKKRLLVFLTDADGLTNILNHQTTYARLKAVGYDDGHIKRLHDEKTKFRIVVFPEGSSLSADWDGMMTACSQVYPETKESCKKYGERFKNTPYTHFEVMAGFSFGDHDKPEDPRFMTYERWAQSDRNFVDLRRLLYHTIHVREKYRGDGYTEGADGRPNVREFMLPNKPIADIAGSVVAELEELRLP